MKRLLSFSVIIIAALLFWGSQTWEKKTANLILESSDPNYAEIFIRDFSMTAMNGDGKPAYILKAKELKQYNNKDYAVIDSPIIQIMQDKQHWLISANSGEINNKNQHLRLNGNVVLLQQNKAQPIQLKTEQLEINVRQQIAKSTQTVSITQQQFILQSKGMVLNMARGYLELLNDVEGSYVQPE